MLVDFQTDAMTDRRATIWNPLRNHEPESIAAGYIRRIHVSNCSDAVLQLPNVPADDKRNACAMRPQEQLSSNCVLWQREDDAKAHKYWLEYHCGYVDSAPGDDDDESVEITLRRVDKVWDLVGYSHHQY